MRTPAPTERKVDEGKKAAPAESKAASASASQQVAVSPGVQQASGKVVATARGAEAAKAAAAANAGAAKARPLRRTVKARDLSGLLSDVAAGRIDAAMAIAMAGVGDDGDGEGGPIGLGVAEEAGEIAHAFTRRRPSASITRLTGNAAMPLGETIA